MKTFDLKILSRPNPRLIALVLALLTLLLFLPVAGYPFLNYDDNDYITNNPWVTHGLTVTDVLWAFTAFYAANWHPLTWMSHQLDCTLFGLAAGPPHLVNLLLHIINTGLVFQLWRRLTGTLWPPALVAALFAWHPLHVESVAWVSERKDCLSTLFGLLALLAYARFARENSRRQFYLAFLYFVLSLLAKPMLVTLPFVLVLLDCWPLARVPGPGKVPGADPGLWTAAVRIAALLREKWLFLLSSAASCLITLLAQTRGGAVMSLARVPWSWRLENAPIALVTYVRKVFWPADLGVIYALHRPSFGQAALCLALLALLTAAAWRWRRQHPCFLFGWLWFAGALAPVLGLVQAGLQSMADRYVYFPAIGLFAALVFLARDGLRELRAPAILAPGLAALTLLACACLTRRQLTFWHDGETLFRRAIAVSHGNLVAMVDLGVALDAQHRFNEALGWYRQAEKLDDGYCFQVHNNLGNILRQQGDHQQALAEYRAAIRERPGEGPLHRAAAAELLQLHADDQALAEFTLAARLDPGSATPRLGAADILLRQGRDAQAVRALREAFLLDPNNLPVLTLAAQVLASCQDSAVRDGRTALQLAFRANDLTGHTQPAVFDLMGMACAELGDFTHAQAFAQTALDLATNLPASSLAPLRERLTGYQHHQPWRQSFAAPPTNTPPPRKSTGLEAIRERRADATIGSVQNSTP